MKIKELRKTSFLICFILYSLLFQFGEASGQKNYSINLKADIQNLEFNVYSIRFIPIDSVFDSNGNIRSQILNELNDIGLNRLKGAYFSFKIGYFQSDTNSKKRNEFAFINIKEYFKKKKSKSTTLVDINCQDILTLNYRAKEYEEISKSTLTNSIFISIHKSKNKAPLIKSISSCYL